MTCLTLAQIADLVEGTVRGDPAVEIRGVGIIRDATAEELTFAVGQNQLAQLATSQARAAIIPRGEDFAGLPVVEVDSPEEAFVKVVQCFRPQEAVQEVGISPAAEVHPTARIDENVTIEAGAVVGPEVEIGRGSHLSGGVQVMSRAIIGEDCQLFPQVTLYENTVVGNRVTIHAGATLGAYGFGYRPGPGGLQLCQQLGNVVVQDDVEIGAATTIDRGTYGATTIGAGTKIDNQVQIGHNCRIGKHNILCAQVGIAGSTTTGDGVVMAGQVGIKDHIDVGDGVRIGAQAGIMDDLEAGMTYVGSPAMPERKQMKIFAVLRQLPELRKQVRALERELEKLRQDLAGEDPSVQDAA